MRREIKRRNTYLSSPIALDPPSLSAWPCVLLTGAAAAAGGWRERERERERERDWVLR